MVGVNSEPGGTAYRANAAYTSGGKTGTAQVVGIKANEKYNAAALAERLRDNALYTAFAPADKPKIVVAMVVENAGWGAEIAAPIARKALDFYLLGKRPADKETTKVPKEDAAEFVPIEDPDAAEAAAARARRACACAGARRQRPPRLQRARRHGRNNKDHPSCAYTKDVRCGVACDPISPCSTAR
jgi:penicillin-binding protein 2